MTKEQLIKEFREKFLCWVVLGSTLNDGSELRWKVREREMPSIKELEAFLLSTFDAGEKNGIVIGRAGGIEEAVRRCAGVITCTQDIDGAVCDCCQRNFEVIDSLTPFSSKDN